MGNLKKVNKILGITLIVFSLGVFANYSKTSSKYFVDDLDDKSDNIVNLISFKSLKYGETKGLVTYSEKLTNLEISDIEYSIKFYRKIVNSNDEDVITDNYRVVVDNGCTVTEVVTPNAPTYVPNQDGSINENSKGSIYTTSIGDGSTTENVVNLTYYNDVESNTSAGSSSNDLITVKYSCPLSVVKRNKDGGGEETSTEFNIYEKINDESEFLYLNYTYTKDFVQKVYNVLINGTRLEKMHIPVDDSMINIDDEFDKWVDAYVNNFLANSDFNGIVPNQVKVYINDKKVRDNPNTGLGLKQSTSDAGAAYKTMYEFDSIMSQAYTYHVNVNGSKPDRPYLYFLESLNETENDALFDNYIKTYYTEFSDAERKIITDYVKASGGITSVINGSTTINGIGHVIGTGAKRYFVYIEENILKKIELEDKIVIAKGGSTPILTTFINAINTKNSKYNWIDSSDFTAFRYIVRSSTSGIQNSLKTTNPELNDYFFIRVSGYVVMIRIYNEADDPDNAYAELYRFKMNASNPASETLEINNPTRLVYTFSTTTSSIDSEQSCIDYTSDVLEAKTGIAPTTYSNVVADAKKWLDTGTNDSTVVDFSKPNLFQIDYKGSSLVQIDRKLYGETTSTVGETDTNGTTTTTTNVAP